MTCAKPFLKWVGGKSQLLEQYQNYYPKELSKGEIWRYIEPFLGGGALFFFIVTRYKIKTAYLADSNPDLLLAYKVVQQNPYPLLELLERYQKLYDQTPLEKRQELFLRVRKRFNEKRPEINYQKLSDNELHRAAQLIFLNKTCFNGLFRLNAKGEFNVPYGKYKTATIFDPATILADSQALQMAEIRCADYTRCADYVNENAFVYFDPPYRPISSTSGFTSYLGSAFNDKQQWRLAQFFRKLDQEKGAKLMLSNSDPQNENPEDDFFEKAFSGYFIFRVGAKRAVNCKGNRRGKINELLITNYPYEEENR